LAEFTLKYEFRVQETGLPAARQALDLDPEDPASLDVIAQESLLLGDALSAEDYLEQALQSDPSHAPAHLHLAVLYLESGETYLAYQHLTQAQSLALPGSATADHARRLLEQLFP
jgi:tetratricopeptide (TPR) repeat protein